MRKWMKDRLKRRKKTDEAAASQPAPLQPAYFESDQQTQTTAPPQKEEEFQPAAEPPEVETGGTGEGGEAEVPEPEDAAGDAVADAGGDARGRNRQWFPPIQHQFRPGLRRNHPRPLLLPQHQLHRLDSVRVLRKELSFWRLDCPGPARVRGSSGTI